MEQNIKLKTEEGAILTIQMKDGVDGGNNTGWNFISTANTATALALGDRVSLDIDAVQTTNAIDLYVDLLVLETRYLTLS